MERVRKRRVCRLWEAMLDAGALSQHVWIACRHVFRKTNAGGWEQFLLVECMLKHLTPTTATVILEDAAEFTVSMWSAFKVLSTLLQQRRIRTLVFSRCDFSDLDCCLNGYLESLNDGLSSLAATCSAVVFRDCEMHLTQNSAQVACAKFCLYDGPAQRLMQLWDVYERSLVRREIDLPRLAERVARCVSTQDTEMCEVILWV
ncbi:uncharacterized protein LOC129591014 [Paramacrobiotus metropolitanus]|uniref:uncharacterized protein LOC129591014 n=1 Tax=Paramacrobiotus metropolitanus TaxID=2943436 RepID=UPI002445937E|nr:uncharacterized protein LOC129591014 [Paramacrobiotus metropolitanus]